MLRIYQQSVFLGLLCLQLHGSMAIIRYKNFSNGTINKGGDTEIEGSGGQLPFSDDEDLVSSGSGSGMGSGMGVNNGDIIIDGIDDFVTTRRPALTTPLSRRPPPLTQCQRDRQIRHKVKCMEDGSFHPMQCNKMPGESECFCVDLHGKEIPGTHMETGNLPDCEEGSNFPPCTFHVVRFRRQNHLLGAYEPTCTPDGLYEKKQCQENMCFCVKEHNGDQIAGTAVSYMNQDLLNCDDHTTGKEDISKNTPVDEDTKEGSIVIDENPDVFEPQPDGDKNTDIDIGGSENDNEDSNEVEYEEDNETYGQGEVLKKKKNSLEEASEIWTQPGILAGIIGGSVVLLLCLVLLVMFVIYRYKKKDEGSYPLDEPNRRTPNYTYVRAPMKEFYA